MHPSQFYIAIVIVALAVIAALLFVVNKNKSTKKLSPLAGIFFGEERFIGYLLKPHR